MKKEILNNIIERIFGTTATAVEISKGQYYVWIDNPFIKLLELNEFACYVNSINIEWRNDGFGLYFSSN